MKKVEYVVQVNDRNRGGWHDYYHLQGKRSAYQERKAIARATFKMRLVKRTITEEVVE